jgi:hypothetical protein
LRYTPTVEVEPAAKASSRLDLAPPGAPGNVTSFQPIGSDGTVSAIPARLPGAPPAQSAAITRVPRTEAERRQVLLARPIYWEFLYFAGQLLHERNSVEVKYRDHELRYAPASREVVIGGEVVSYVGRLNNPENIFDYLSVRFKDTVNLAERMTGNLKDEAALERAFGAPGQDGDAERLAHLAKRWNKVYEEFLDWAATLRGASVPSGFRNLLELAARYADEPVEKYRGFVDEYVTQVDAIYGAIPASIAAGKPIRIEVNLVLSNREEVVYDYVAELNRLKSRLHQGEKKESGSLLDQMRLDGTL